MKPITIDLEGVTSLKQAKAAFEKEFIVAQLKRFAGNVMNTALALDMDRPNLYKLIKRHKILIIRGH